MLEFTNVNYDPIKFIEQINKQICINDIITNIGKADIIRRNIANTDKKIIE